jgi:hypothetical protein
MLLRYMGSWMREKPGGLARLYVPCPASVVPVLVVPCERKTARMERKEQKLKSLKRVVKRERREGRYDAMR